VLVHVGGISTAGRAGVRRSLPDPSATRDPPGRRRDPPARSLQELDVGGARCPGGEHARPNGSSPVGTRTPASSGTPAVPLSSRQRARWAARPRRRPDLPRRPTQAREPTRTAVLPRPPWPPAAGHPGHPAALEHDHRGGVDM